MTPNQPKTQRVSPSPAAVLSEPTQASEPRSPASRKKNQRCEQIASEWELRRTLGWDLDAKALSRRLGKSPTWVTRRLAGHDDITDMDVLHFARELDIAPQKLCSDWPFADLTATPSLVLLDKHWQTLEISTRSALVAIIKADGNVKHIPGSNLIHILPGAPRRTRRR